MLSIDIISPEKTIYSGSIKSVVFPGKAGSFGVLKNHAPIISTLVKGVIKITDNTNKTIQFEVERGVVEVKNNQIIVLVESGK